MKKNITKKRQFSEIIEKLKQQKTYFSYEEIKDLIKKEKINITPSSLKSYVHELTKSGEIFDAGKGWYSTIKEPFKLNTRPVKSIIKKINREFPLLDFSCWSTEQLNFFTHHLMAKFITFIYADSDYINTVANVLEDNGYNVYRNPTKDEILKFFKITDKTVILMPSITKQPQTHDKLAPIEKILIDFLMENRNFNIMDEQEAENVVINALNSGRINMASLISYTNRRKFNTSKIINQVQLDDIGGDS